LGLEKPREDRPELVGNLHATASGTNPFEMPRDPDRDQDEDRQRRKYQDPQREPKRSDDDQQHLHTGHDSAGQSSTARGCVDPSGLFDPTR